MLPSPTSSRRHRLRGGSLASLLYFLWVLFPSGCPPKEVGLGSNKTPAHLKDELAQTTKSAVRAHLWSCLLVSFSNLTGSLDQTKLHPCSLLRFALTNPHPPTVIA